MATNRVFEEEVKANRFREDLYFRLGGLRLSIPPLRSRKEDVRDLVEENERRLRGKALGEGFWREVLAYDWPGNVRELLHVLTRAGIELDGPIIDEEIRDFFGTRFRRADDSRLGLRGKLESQIETGRSFWETFWQAFLERDLNRQEMRSFLVERYGASGRSIKRLAQDLNVSETEYARFVSALHKYDIHPAR